MDSEHIRLLINNKQKEIEDLRRVLEDLELKEAAEEVLETARDTELATRGWLPVGAEATLFHSPIKFDIGSTVYYSKETRGKRRHYSLSGVVVKRDKKFLHIRDAKGNVIRRTPKYVRRIAIIEE